MIAAFDARNLADAWVLTNRAQQAADFARRPAVLTVQALKAASSVAVASLRGLALLILLCARVDALTLIVAEPPNSRVMAYVEDMVEQGEAFSFEALPTSGPVTIPADGAVIIYRDAPRGFDGVLGIANWDKRVIYVFTDHLEAYLGIDRNHPRFANALARVIVHELEHIRRGNDGHDKSGWFRSCLDRAWLTAPGATR